MTPPITIAKESAKHTMSLDRATSYPLCATTSGKAKTIIAPKIRPSVIVATNSLPLATKATMKPIHRNVRRNPMSMPVLARNTYKPK